MGRRIRFADQASAPVVPLLKTRSGSEKRCAGLATVGRGIRVPTADLSRWLGKTPKPIVNSHFLSVKQTWSDIGKGRKRGPEKGVENVR